jgi:hypothetical protein
VGSAESTVVKRPQLLFIPIFVQLIASRQNQQCRVFSRATGEFVLRQPEDRQEKNRDFNQLPFYRRSPTCVGY